MPLMISVGHAEICCMELRTSCLIGFRWKLGVPAEVKKNQTFDSWLVSDWDLSVKEQGVGIQALGLRSSSFMLSVFSDCVAETTHFRPIKYFEFHIAHKQVARRMPFHKAQQPN